MKHFLLITILMSAISFTPIFATGENRSDAPNNSVLKRGALYVANGMVSAGLGIITVTKGIELGSSIPKEYKELHNASAELYSIDKRTQELATCRKVLPQIIEEQSKMLNLSVPETFLQKLSDFNNEELYQSYRWASDDVYEARQNQKRIGSAFLHRNTYRLVVITGCAYGTYWFGKNAYKQLSSFKE